MSNITSTTESLIAVLADRYHLDVRATAQVRAAAVWLLAVSALTVFGPPLRRRPLA